MKTTGKWVAMLIGAFTLAACGGGETTTDTTGGSGGTAGSGGTGGSGATFTEPEAGITECADIFTENGICKPSISLCPAGQIPKLEVGCVPVGIATCAEVFMEEDGLCHPSMSKCPEGTFVVPSEGCVPVDGAGCGQAPWGDVPDDVVNVYVDPAYLGGDGDGSKVKPFVTIADALLVAADGDRVVLAAGTYDEPAILTKGIDLVGRCPSMVRVQGLGTLSTFDVVVGVKSAAPVSIRRISVGGAGFGIKIESSTVHVEEVWIDGATIAALSSVGTSIVTASHLLIENTQPDASGNFGEGVTVLAGADVTVEKTTMRNLHVRALANAGGGNILRVSDSLIEDILPAVAGNIPAYGFALKKGPVEISNTAIVGVQVGGALYDAASLKATSILVADVTDSLYGYGLFLDKGTKLTLLYSAVVHNTGAGLVALGDGTQVDSVANLYAWSGGADGIEADGMYIDEGAELASSDDAIVGNEGIGLIALRGAKLTVAGTLIEANQPMPFDGTLGVGVAPQLGTNAIFDHVAIIGNRVAGLFVSGGAPMDLTEVKIAHSLVDGTLPDSAADTNGVGIHAGFNAKLTVESTLVTGNVAGGIVVAGGEATITDSIVRGVKKGKLTIPDGTMFVDGVADGIIAQGQTGSLTLTLSATLVEGCERAGILFKDAGGSITASRSTGNAFGLVTQGMPLPTIADDNSFTDNTDTDVVENGMLALP